MGDCKTCSRVDVCTKSGPENNIYGRIEENRRIASTRTISNFPKYTPEVRIKTASRNNNDYQFKPPTNFWGGFSQNSPKKSLFSLYTHPQSPAPSPAPRTKSTTTASKTTRSVLNLSVGNMWLNPVKRKKPTSVPKTKKPVTTQKPKTASSKFKAVAPKRNLANKQWAKSKITEKPVVKKTTAADLLNRYTKLKSDSAKSSTAASKHKLVKKKTETTKKGAQSSAKLIAPKSPIVWNVKDLRKMLEETSVTKVGKKITPLEAILSGLHFNPLNVKKSGDSDNVVGESIPFGASAGSVDSMWGKLEPKRIPRYFENIVKKRFYDRNFRKLETELLPTTMTTTTTRVPTTTTPMWWRYTSTLPRWAKEELQKINRPKKYSEYIWVNGQRRRVPDFVLTKLEMEKAESKFFYKSDQQFIFI